MSSVFARVARALLPSAMAGGFFLLSIGRANDPSLSRLGLLLLGGLLGVAITGLIRLFRVARWGYPWVGLFCGLALPGILFGADGGSEDRAGFLLVAALLGAFLGVIEWARVSASREGVEEERPEIGNGDGA